MEPFPEIPDFEVLACLGYGARSTIYAVSEKATSQLYALKRVMRNSADDDRFLEQAEQEFAISSQFTHPVLRKSYRLIRRRRMLKVAELSLLMDMVDGVSLDVQRPQKLQVLLRIFGQVAQGPGKFRQTMDLGGAKGMMVDVTDQADSQHVSV